MDLVEKIRVKVRNLKFGVELKAYEAKMQVKIFRKSVEESLEELEHEMNNKINAICQEEFSYLDKLLQECDEVESQFQTMTEEVKSKETGFDSTHNLFVKSKITERKIEIFKERNMMKNLQKKTEVKHVRIQPYFSKALSGKSFHGDIVTVPIVTTEKTKWENVGTINCKTNTEIKDSKDFSVSSCIALKNGKLMACGTKNNSVRLCRTDNSMLSCEISSVISSLETDDEPKDITQICDDMIAVTLPSVKKIQYIRIDKDNILGKKRSIHVKGKCYGIGCLEDTLIVSYKYPGKVELMDFDGNVLKTVKNDIEMKFEFLKPQSVTCDAIRKVIYVSDFEGNCIVASDQEGKVKAVFKKDGMHKPLGITMGKDGSVLIAVHWPYSIQRLSPFFLDIEELQVRGDTREINCVAYSEVQDRIFFGKGDSNVYVVKID